jgi:hypothetical protein
MVVGLASVVGDGSLDGVAPLDATVYELERLRCNLCGEVFTASAPDGIGDTKYDATAAAMLALLRYGCALPLHRVERLGENLGMPMPSGTQWGVVETAASACESVWEELIRLAAAGEVMHIDDTNCQVLEPAGLRCQQPRSAGRKSVLRTLAEGTPKKAPIEEHRKRGACVAVRLASEHEPAWTVSPLGSTASLGPQPRPSPGRR